MTILKSKVYGEAQLIQPATWSEYLEETGDAGFFDYIQATVGITNQIDNILSKTHDFDTLKKELSNFIEERQAFVLYAEANFPK